MKSMVCRALLLPIFLVGLVATARAQTGISTEESRFPNELPGFVLYRDAKWKTIEPFRSTKEEVERVLGEPVPMFSESLKAWMMGYENDPDWRLIVIYVGEGSSLPESLTGHVLNIRLEPKKRLSLEGFVFPVEFLKGYLKDRVRNIECFTYDDRYGLHYSLYAKDSPDGRFHKGDLQVIVYGASEETEGKYARQ
jgi:hypothetical protein